MFAGVVPGRRPCRASDSMSETGTAPGSIFEQLGSQLSVRQDRVHERNRRRQMRCVTPVALIAVLLASTVFAGDPLKGASYREHLAGPTLEPGALEGKVVLLEYFSHT